MPVHPKVQTAGIAAAATVLVVWAASLAGLDIPPEVSSAFTTIVAFAAGWLQK